MTQINLKSDVLAKDEQYVWHSMKPYNPQATYVVAKSDGAIITDTDGLEYIDAMAGLLCVNVVYGRKELAYSAH